MNVKELIEILSSLPQEADVILEVNHDDFRLIEESRITSETITYDPVLRVEISGDENLKDAIVIRA